MLALDGPRFPTLANALLVFSVFAAGLTAAGPAAAEQDDDAERVPSSAADVYSPIARTFTRQHALPGGPLRAEPQFVREPQVPEGPVLLEDVKRRLQNRDPFFRDSVVELYGRSQYLDRHNADDTVSQAWAAGTALAIRSGYHDGWLQLEAAAATSQPLYAPDGEGGTLLLTDQQAEVSSVAIANARLRFAEHEAVLGRQLIKTPYVNPHDTRMIPNAFEGVVIERRRDQAQQIDYGIGYLWGFKGRDSSRFVPFSEELGLSEDRGMLLGGFKVTPLEGLTLGAIEYLIPDTLNTVYAEIDWVWVPSSSAPQVHVALNYTDQRTIGDPFLIGRSLATDQISALFATSYHNATLLAAVSANGRGSDLFGPFGSFPTYTALDQLNFNDAGQTTVVLGAAYDFSHIITDGLKFQVRYGIGWDVVDPLTGAPESDQSEVNLELEYHPTSGPLKDLYFQVFYSGVRFPGNAPPLQEDQPQIRSVLTYLVPVL